ncbi:hypothetical protein [Shimia sediminis]|nr:hypothetical protein [Shimia sediminis]
MNQTKDLKRAKLAEMAEMAEKLTETLRRKEMMDKRYYNGI